MSKNKKSKSGESKTNKLERYERRVNQLETRREYFDAKIKFIENNFDKLVAEGVASLTTQEKARGYSIENRLKNDLDSFKKSRAKLDFLLLRNKGGVITQDMIDYNWPKKFQYTNEAENRDYVAGDVFVPRDTDRVNLIKNVKTDLGLIEPEVVEEEPVVESIDYYGKTDDKTITNDKSKNINELIQMLTIQENSLERSEGKIDLTRTLQIEPRMELQNAESKSTK
tara:strand:- start:103 stop:780 length:678 start_codon:yes stop_codon:yes gene_type:complete